MNCSDGEKKIIYWIDGNNIHLKYGFIEKGSHESLRNRPSIHMPRWASRIQLEITDIRVERLNSLTEEDAKAEGTPFFTEREHPYGKEYRYYVIGKYSNGNPKGHLNPVFGFQHLWDSINGKKEGRSWSENPHVWIVEFKVVK